MVEKFINGYNCAFLAYGQTNSGKTYTVLGADNNDEANFGMVKKACVNIFDGIEEKKFADPNKRYSLKLSMYEIYCEKITDMFNQKSKQKASISSSEQDHLKIRESKTKGRYIEGLESFNMVDKDSGLEMINEGAKRRTVGATAFNTKSSRSHLIFCFTLTANSSEYKDKISKLYMIDLAGSEASSVQGKTSGSFVNRSKDKKLRLETKKINTS